MFFRSQKKLQGEISLSETLETDKDGNDLSILDVVGVEDTMLDDLETRESHIRVRQLVDECLTEREADIIRQRYGLTGKPPRTQRELAADYGISRSYVSRRAYGKRRPEAPRGGCRWGDAARKEKERPEPRCGSGRCCTEREIYSAAVPFLAA